jgi:hypothetical protein
MGAPERWITYLIALDPQQRRKVFAWSAYCWHVAEKGKDRLHS